MKYFRMSRRFPALGGWFPQGTQGSFPLGGQKKNRRSPAAPVEPPEPAGIFQGSHDMLMLKTGQRLERGVKGPFKVFLDPEMQMNVVLPTFFESPAWIATKAFYQDLRAIGIDNVDTLPVELRIGPRKRINRDYLLLNIIGCVPCADMRRSTMRSLGEGMNVITRLVVHASRVGKLELFVAAEDTDCMIVSERVASHLQACGYEDVRFDALRLS